MERKPNANKLINIENLPLLDAINKQLFKLSEVDQSNMTVKELELHVNRILEKLYNYKPIGFVNNTILRDNEIYQIFRSVYPKYRALFAKPSVQVMFEVEHFHNLILLLLVTEIEILLEKLEPVKGVDGVLEGMSDLRALKQKLLKNVSAPLRSALSKNLLSFQNKVYTAFDTEYNTVDEGKTDLLCLTTSTHIGVLLRVKLLKLDYTISNHHGVDNKPICSDLLQLMVRLIRLINNKNDDKLIDLLSNLRNDTKIEELVLNDSSVFRVKQVLSPTDFINRYYDLTTDPKFHSFTNLMDISLNLTTVKLKEAETVFRELMKSVGYNLDLYRVSTEKIVYLIAHFTTADISSWSDFEEVKESFGILRKCFITIDSKKRYNG